MTRPNLTNSSIGDYRLVDYIGAGGMGEVYRGVHSKIGRVVAIKVLTQSVPGSSWVVRFQNEARIQASLHHHNIVTLYDFLEFNGQPCIVMEYIDGQTVAERIKAFGILPIEEALYILQSVAEAVHYVHSQGIVHRDIKSNNIRISSTGAVKLLDFGIAKSDDTPSLTITGDVVGTLEYLSPEQVKGGTADARSDIWALGVLLYEMVTGQVPFKSPSIGELCDNLCKADYAPVWNVNPSVPREVEAIISRCLKKKPGDRYQTAWDLLQDSRRITAGVAAPDLTASDHKSLVAVAKKHWWKLAAAVVTPLVLILALYFTIFPSDDSSGRQPTQQDNQKVTPPPKPPDKGGKVTPPRPQVPIEHYKIDTMDGAATVEITGSGGKRVGRTPFEFDAAVGEQFDVVLKRDGFRDLHDNFTVTVGKHEYSYALTKQ
jgi:eukaryotic-like serine/threonine-protein kinase